MAGAIGAERVLDVVELMIEHPEGIALSEIGRQLGLAKSATHRLLTLLCDRGYVEQPRGLNTYRLGLKLSAMGFRYVAQTGVFDICQPFLDLLAQQTGELVRMTLADQRGLTWGARAQGAVFGLRYEPNMGAPVVLHATATGRTWLASLPDDEAVAIVEAHGFAVPDRFGRQKIQNKDDLLAELARTRQRGYALAIEESEPGMSAIAMSIPRHGGGRDPGSISVAGPMVRLTAAAIEVIIPRLQEATSGIAELWPVIEGRARLS